MTGPELRAWRKRLGLTQSELAAHLDHSEFSIRRWERGQQPVPGWVGLALDGLEAGGWSAPAMTGPQAFDAWVSERPPMLSREYDLAQEAYRRGWMDCARRDQAILSSLAAADSPVLAHTEPR